MSRIGANLRVWGARPARYYRCDQRADEAVNRESRIQIPGEIQLADEPELTVGRMVVRPATLEIMIGGKLRTIEPRMMQLLVALARAGGQVVSRDSLVTSCWGGRAVGDDAINRCVAKVRRLENGAAGFRIETINRVGYRLVETASDVAEATETPSQAPSAERQASRINRRLFLGAGAAAVVAAGAGFVILGRHGDSASPPDDVAALMVQAKAALNQCDPEGNNQAVGLLRRVVDLRSDYGEGWGLLSLAYALRANGLGASNFEAAAQDARLAAQRALQLDQGNGYAKAAFALLLPSRGNWGRIEQALDSALADRPRDPMLSILRNNFLIHVGRCTEAAAALDNVASSSQPSPAFLYMQSHVLWMAGRQADANQAIERGYALYPTYVGIWFIRFFAMMTSGRAAEAVRFAENVDTRPIGVPAQDVDNELAVARALASGRPDDADRAIALNRAAARRGVGYAENLIQFAALLGRVDDAFAAADDFYFGPSATRAATRFTSEQGKYSRAGERDSILLFTPMSRAMRSDPRFGRLTTALGLDQYWTESGHQPDFRRSPA